MARFERVVLKNAGGHAYFEYGEPMLEPPVHVRIWPLEIMTAVERREFEGLSHVPSLAPWPEVGGRMMTRLASGEDMSDSWVVVQEGTYRYAVEQESGLRVRSVLSEYLGTEVLWKH